MNAESISRIDGFLSSSVSELFVAYGLRLEKVELKGRGLEDSFVSTIGFTSPRLVGALVLTVSRVVAERSLPENLRTPTVADTIIADWTGELSNQALGRIKNRFSAVGIDITLSTPTVFSGKELRHFSHASPLNRSLFFQGVGALLVEFQADFDADFEIGAEEAGQETGPAEGEALFF